MKRSEKLALFLGMLSGDGCLPIHHNGKGYRDYAVQFYNTNKDRVELFNRLFLDIFGVNGTIGYCDRLGKQRLWSFCKYSKKITEEIRNWGFPEGVKRDVLRVLPIVFKGTNSEKLEFIRGVLITDGCVRKNETIIFHSGSELFLNDLSDLIGDIIGIRKPIKEYVQREKYKSFQLNLNKKESALLLSDLKDKPTWDNGTPIALSFKTR